MNTDTFEQIFLEKTMVGGHEFMKEGQIVEVVFDADEENPLTCDLPSSVVLEITYLNQVKKEYCYKCNKTSNCRNRSKCKCTPFINEGDKIKIDTVKGAYRAR